MKKDDIRNIIYFSNPILKKIRDPYLLIFCVILSAGIFFRFYNTPARYGFDFDAARDALVSFEGASHMTFPLVGPQSAQGAFTFGPWYYYFLIIFTIIFPFGYAPWIFMGVLSVLVIVVSYVFGIVIEDKKLGLIFALLTSFASSQVVLSTNLSNPDLIPILSWISLLFFVVFVKKSLSKYLLVLWGLCLGIGFLSHFQMAGLFMLPVIACVYKKKNILYNFLFILLGLLVSYIPTFVFDLTHKWHTVKGLMYYVLHGSLHPNYYPNSWKIYLLSFWPEFWSNTLGVSFFYGVFLLVLALLVIIVLLFKKKVSRELLLILFSFVCIFIAFRYYSGERAVYYLYFLQPFVFIFTGYSLWKLGKGKLGKLVQIILLSIFLFLAVGISLNQLKFANSHKKYTALAQKILDANAGKSISLYACNNLSLNKTYAVSYILSLRDKESSRGTKLGLYDENCKKFMKKSIAQEKFVVNDEGSESKIYNLSSYALSNLSENNWFLVNPKTVYDTIINPY